jgi:hypothetical protein
VALKIERLCENHSTRVRLSGELRDAHLVDLRAEIDQFGQPSTLDLNEVNVVDIDGIRFLNQCQTEGIDVVNCSPYIREWMRQERRALRDDE